MSDTSFNITDSAKNQVENIIQKEENPKESFLRVEVLSGGCSGFQYHFDMDTNQEEGDIIICNEEGKPIVVIDSTSADMLKNATLDFISEIGSAHFKITNPNSSASCGCGNSFSV